MSLPTFLTFMLRLLFKGIDIYFFNSPVVVQNLRTAQDVRGLFRRVEPRRSTPTATALKKVVEPYLLKLEAAHRAKETGGAVQTVKPLSIIVLTGKQAIIWERCLLRNFRD